MRHLTSTSASTSLSACRLVVLSPPYLNRCRQAITYPSPRMAWLRLNNAAGDGADGGSNEPCGPLWEPQSTPGTQRFSWAATPRGSRTRAPFGSPRTQGSHARPFPDPWLFLGVPTPHLCTPGAATLGGRWSELRRAAPPTECRRRPSKRFPSSTSSSSFTTPDQQLPPSPRPLRRPSAAAPSRPPRVVAPLGVAISI
jgi:hypothetical protein